VKAGSVLAAGAAFILGACVAAGLYFARKADSTADIVPPSHPSWAEAQWPFPIDQWGKGKAFRCTAADCGTDVDLFIRAKIGFCNCTTGVADDDELKRLSDFDFMGNQPDAMADGRIIAIAWMKGRSRPYLTGGGVHSALSVAFNDHCDAIVATAIMGHNRPSLLETDVLAFLNSKAVLDWAKITLGL